MFVTFLIFFEVLDFELDIRNEVSPIIRDKDA